MRDRHLQMPVFAIFQIPPGVTRRFLPPDLAALTSPLSERRLFYGYMKIDIYKYA